MRIIILCILGLLQGPNQFIYLKYLEQHSVGAGEVSAKMIINRYLWKHGRSNMYIFSILIG